LTLIGRRHAYHGMHAWGTSLGGIPMNLEGFGTLVGDVVHVDADSVDDLADTIERLGPDRVAAFIGEPVIGAGGVLPPPDGYWREVAELCREHDVLLIADEVITGFGRLGHRFGCDRYGFAPDLLVFAKGVTSGYMPLGGVVVGARVQEPFWRGDGAPFRHGYTYSGHAAACAAGLANLEILERERLVDRVAEIEPLLAQRVDALRDEPLVRETRAVGLMAAVELDADALEREPRLLDRVVAGAREHGVLTRSLRGRALHVSPAFVVSPQQLDALVDGLRAALAAARPEEVGSGPAT
jgi:adenosylmethionine-8-amino-7-oxononanoate aminotransferase